MTTPLASCTLASMNSGRVGWERNLGSRIPLRYTPTTCFETFPFPRTHRRPASRHRRSRRTSERTSRRLAQPTRRHGSRTEKAHPDQPLQPAPHMARQPPRHARRRRSRRLRMARRPPRRRHPRKPAGPQPGTERIDDATEDAENSRAGIRLQRAGG